ncbi:MAG: diaminopimelate epimerase [Gemmatimonadaceae bacterium]
MTGGRGAQEGRGRPFVKMSGSGNDFVFFDARTEPAGELAVPETVRRICARGTGIGADGVVFLERSERADFGIRYLNSDGSPASLCGNASLCSTRLASELGAADPAAMRFETGSGVLSARLRDGLPEIDLQPVRDVRPAAAGIEPAAGERRIGFALAGVPHLVILCDDVERVELARRGPPLRAHATLPEGANVNWVSRRGDGWAIRTFERGVEGETLACGTGAVAAAVLLAAWGEAPADAPAFRAALATRSGRVLEVSLAHDGVAWLPSLRGEGRLVFRGELADI